MNSPEQWPPPRGPNLQSGRELQIHDQAGHQTPEIRTNPRNRGDYSNKGLPTDRWWLHLDQFINHRTPDPSWPTFDQNGELEDLRISIARANADLKAMSLKVHCPISSSPEIYCVIEEMQKTPFTPQIINTRIQNPGKIKVPIYEGNSDPKAHAFCITMGRSHFEEHEKDAEYYPYLIEHLNGSALNWFSHLEENSIDNFNHFSIAFVKYYSMFIEKGATDAGLWTLLQLPTESLRVFSERFKAIISDIVVSDEVGLATLKMPRGTNHDSVMT